MLVSSIKAVETLKHTHAHAEKERMRERIDTVLLSFMEIPFKWS